MPEYRAWWGFDDSEERASFDAVMDVIFGTIDLLPAEVRATVKGYNKDDCVSTLRLRDWLETVRRSAEECGALLPRPVLEPSEPTEELNDRQRRTDSGNGRQVPRAGGTGRHL